jgi:hypothetical protein
VYVPFIRCPGSDHECRALPVVSCFGSEPSTFIVQMSPVERLPDSKVEYAMRPLTGSAAAHPIRL